MLAGHLGGALLGAHNLEPVAESHFVQILSKYHQVYTLHIKNTFAFFILYCSYLLNTEKHTKKFKKIIITAHSQQEARLKGKMLLRRAFTFLFLQSPALWREDGHPNLSSRKGPTDISTAGAPEQQPDLSRSTCGPIKAGVFKGRTAGPCDL